jgi:hypothetical protein
MTKPESKRRLSVDPEPDLIVVDAVESKELEKELETVEIYGGERGPEASMEHEQHPDKDAVLDEEPVKEETSKAADALNGFWERQAKRVARNPCWHLNVSLLVSIGLSVIAIIVGEFSISANSGGWQSRGTLIADRQTQLMLTEQHQLGLLYGGDEAWDELLTTVQPGWEDDDDADDSERRRLSEKGMPTTAQAQSVVDFLTPKADRILLPEKRELPFTMTPHMERRLQEQPSLEGCDLGFYNAETLTGESRLWPVWKTTQNKATALDADVIYDICVTEQATLAHLEDKELCFGCDNGKCVPPYSIVLYARLTVDDGLTLTCEDLRDAWAPYQESTAAEWKTCVEAIKTEYDPNDLQLPDSCPEYFMPALVDESFDTTLLSKYTSSIFPTRWQDVDGLYEEVDLMARGSGKIVQAAYDTQYEDFLNIYVDASLTQDMALAMGSAFVVAIAIVLHTRSPFISLIGLVQIILSFPLSYFVYKLVLGYVFFPFLNFIGIFVVFALGAGTI